jgi:hypothetical protein
MLTLTGTLRTAHQVGGGTNRSTGELVPVRSVIQVETTDNRGLVDMHLLYVPDHRPFEAQIGQEVTLPVRAWAKGAAVNLAYAEAGR